MNSTRDALVESSDSNNHAFLGVPIPDKPEPSIAMEPINFAALPSPHTYVRRNIREAVSRLLRDAYPEMDLQIQISNDTIKKSLRKLGISIDFSVPAFSVIKKCGAASVSELAEQIAVSSPYIKDVHVSGPFLNIELDYVRYGEAVLEQAETLKNCYGHTNIGNGEIIVIDCSSPNIAKYMSVAHLRSTVIGESLYHIYRALGYEAIRDNHLGDWGTQFGMLGRAFELWGDEVAELKSQDGSEVVRGLFKLYVRIHEEIHREKVLNDDAESALEKEGRNWFLRLEQGEPEAIDLWRWALNVSLIEFKAIYKRLRVDFEYWLGESFYVPLGCDLVDAMLARRCASQDDEGRIIVTFDESSSLHPLTIRKSDGTGLYSTRDLCGLAARTSWFSPKKIIYVVGEDQATYFQQLFKAFRSFVGDNVPEMVHVAFGMLSLPEGKMSTRRGNVIFLEDVIEEAVTRAREKMLSNYGANVPEGLDIDSAAESIGIGAVIYSDLGDVRRRHIKFDWETALTFEGNSGPYLQYAYARIVSIEQKIKTQPF